MLAKSNELGLTMKKLPLILLATLLPFALLGQQKQEEYQLFKAGVLAGFNVSQVEGDGVAGYNKIGANGGATAYVRFHENMSVSFEILYSQKGAKRTLTNASPECSYKLVLDYIDVPVLFNYHDNKIGIFSAGLSVGNLIRTKEKRQGLETPIPNNSYNSRVLEGVVSVTFMLTDNLGLNLRGSYSLGGIGQRTLDPNHPFDKKCLSGNRFGTLRQFNNVLTLRGLWRF